MISFCTASYVCISPIDSIKGQNFRITYKITVRAVLVEHYRKGKKGKKPTFRWVCRFASLVHYTMFVLYVYCRSRNVGVPLMLANWGKPVCVCVWLTLKTPKLMDTKSDLLVKALKWMDANISGLTVLPLYVNVYVSQVGREGNIHRHQW